MKRTLRSQRGETLVEGLATLAIFSIGLLGILGMNVVASKQNGLASRETAAANIARSLIDDLNQLPYTHAAFANPSTLATSASAFIDPTQDTGTLHNINEISNGGTAQPLLGAAQQMWQADGNGGVRYTVQWRVADQTDASGNVQGHVIAVMVTFTIPGTAQKKQITLWTVQYNPATVLDGAGGLGTEV